MFLITLEGIDGCGKSTAANYVYEYLKEKNFKVILTREPGGDRIAESLREIILDPKNIDIASWTEALLYIASRAQHISNVISPAIKSNKIVVCERFSDSTNVYQGYARGLGYEHVNQLQNIVYGYIRPDLTIFLDIEPDEAIKRVEARTKETKQKKDRLESEGREFFNSVYQGYKDIIASDKSERFMIVNARKNLKNVKQQIEDVVRNFLEVKLQKEL
ncbi:dTMP kinase [Spiroplasma endosymbiont of Aspidapion aeneum]|uniref:dTMP kinase n=1 Tax=Spiroplasma endosymbiont of Aspidapion aeneum TaxID=3066276 RepID=UPI00313C3658